MREATKEDRIYGWHPISNHMVALTGVQTFANLNSETDVGLVVIPHDLASHVADPGHYLELDQIDSGHVAREKEWHLVSGYPTALYLPGPRKLRLMRYLSWSKSRLCEREHNPDADVILSFNPEPRVLECVNLRDTSIKGMSGGGIWRFFIPRSRQPWWPSDLRLVGIQYLKGPQYLKGSRIRCSLRLLAESMPDLSSLVYQKHPDAKDAPLGMM
jgi:hypothetical protein